MKKKFSFNLFMACISTIGYLIALIIIGNRSMTSMVYGSLFVFVFTLFAFSLINYLKKQ